MKRINFTTSSTITESGHSAAPVLNLDGHPHANLIQVVKLIADTVDELVERENRRWEQEKDERSAE